MNQYDVTVLSEANPSIVVERIGKSVVWLWFLPYECAINAQMLESLCEFYRATSGGAIRIGLDELYRGKIVLEQNLAAPDCECDLQRAIHVLEQRLKETCRTSASFDPHLDYA